MQTLYINTPLIRSSEPGRYKPDNIDTKKTSTGHDGFVAYTGFIGFIRWIVGNAIRVRAAGETIYPNKASLEHFLETNAPVKGNASQQINNFDQILTGMKVDNYKLKQAQIIRSADVLEGALKRIEKQLKNLKNPSPYVRQMTLEAAVPMLQKCEKDLKGLNSEMEKQGKINKNGFPENVLGQDDVLAVQLQDLKDKMILLNKEPPQEVAGAAPSSQLEPRLSDADLQKAFNSKIDLSGVIRGGIGYASALNKLVKFPEEAMRLKNQIQSSDSPAARNLLPRIQEMEQRYQNNVDRLLEGALTTAEREINEVTQGMNANPDNAITDLGGKLKFLNDVVRELDEKDLLSPELQQRDQALKQQAKETLTPLAERNLRNMQNLMNSPRPDINLLIDNFRVIKNLSKALSELHDEESMRLVERLNAIQTPSAEKITTQLWAPSIRILDEIPQKIAQAQAVLNNPHSTLKDFVRTQDALEKAGRLLAEYQGSLGEVRSSFEGADELYNKIALNNRECNEERDLVLAKQTAYATASLKKVDMPKSGHCMFHTFAHHLFGDEMQHMRVKKMAAESIRGNPERFKERILNTFRGQVMVDGAADFMTAYREFYNEHKRDVQHETAENYLRDLDDNQLVEEYCQCLESDAHLWGGEMEMEALSLVLRRPFCNARFGERDQANQVVILNVFNPDLMEREEPFVLCYNGRSHYDAFDRDEEKLRRWMAVGRQ